MKKIIFIIFLFVLLASCSNETVKDPIIKKEPQANEASNNTKYADNKQKVDELLKVEKSFEPSYSVLNEDNVSTDEANRYKIRISVPLGLTKEELESNLKLSAKSAYETYHPNALVVFAYREDDEMKKMYSAGKLVLAPYGDWEKANEKVDSGKYEMVIEMAKTYLNPKKSIGVGATIQFYGDVSNKSESWDSEDIILSIPEQTSAKIVEIKKFPMGSMEFIRYKVELNDQGKTISGWIHDYDVIK